MKQWYDGFIFGGHRDIYNPWSITNYLKEKKLRPYWADTSSNGLAGKLIRTASPEIKEYMEDLLNGQAVTVNFDEQMVFEQLDYNENAIWSLLLASGYLKAEEVEYRGITLKPWYQLRITNLETVSMFDDMFRGWFEASEAGYTRNNAGNITCFVDRIKIVVHIGKSGRCCLISGCMAELNLRVLCCCLKQVALMSKACTENNVTSLIC